MIKIGYLNDPSVSEFESVGTSICNMEETQPKKVKGVDSQYTKFCPSIKTYYENTFEVKCPFDLEFKVEHKDSGEWNWEIINTTINIPNQYFNPEEILNFSPDGKVVQIYPNPNWSFISDTENVILMQHTNGIDTNPQIVTGWLDIYKWPDRPLSIAYNIHKSIQTIKIKKGQPWYRLTFITPEFESVKLIRMYERCSFLLNTKNKSKMAVINKLNWKKVFNWFGNTRPKRLIEEK
tara:strand:+ start:401 stop:1108 length:708 start_codon:yes stop_codon:yes gene_type:complete